MQILPATIQEFTLVTILITNDDGINSEGLKSLSEVLRELGEVFTVAPDRQRSAVGLSITLERPLRVENVSEKAFSVDGMPADCVTLAIRIGILTVSRYWAISSSAFFMVTLLFYCMRGSMRFNIDLLSIINFIV